MKRLFFETIYENNLADACTEIMIYGAGYIAKNIILYLKEITPKIKVVGVVVSYKSGNPDRLFGIPIYELDEMTPKHKELPIIVATSEKYHDEIVNQCEKRGYRNIYCISNEDEWKLHKRYKDLIFPKGSINSKDLGRIEHENYKVEKKNETINIYRVCSGKDKACAEGSTEDDFHHYIFAGASIFQSNSFDINDSCGENISYKNPQYCELTALYWLWKNCNDDYWGIEHYRRIFDIKTRDIEKIVDNKIDVILPKPTILYTSLEEHYVECHSAYEWNIMKDVLLKLYPEYKHSMQIVFSGKTFYEYNMLIAKKEIMRDYCEWLFKILFQVEAVVGEKEDLYQNRYIGFLAERILAVYFYHNRKSFYIAHTNVEMLF